MKCAENASSALYVHVIGRISSLALGMLPCQIYKRKALSSFCERHCRVLPKVQAESVD